MSRRPPRPWARAAATGIAALTGLALTGTAHAAPRGDASGTATGGEITARWWQVALAPGDFSFWDSSTTGGNCRTVDLPSGTVVMVAGTFSGPSGERACEIPAGATVVIPVIVDAYFLTDPRPADTVAEARGYTSGSVEGAAVEATIDGEPVRIVRKKSSAFIANGAALSGLSGAPPDLGDLRATSDGYWVFWEATPGTHVVRTSGSASFSTSSTYTFVVR